MSDKSLVHHVYDGIEEHDNHLPNWWLGLLWTTIAFGFGYWFYFHVAEVGTLQLGEYQQEAAEAARRSAGNQPLSDETLLAMLKDEQQTSTGKQLFQQNCASCHGVEGQGIIGPNLTDNAWLYGGKPVDIHKTIAEGAVAKGMPAWERTLGAGRVRALTAYVLTLKGRNVAGKAPQGEPEQ
jgi:cytochrome c oxidase cbb3-type subunit III